MEFDFDRSIIGEEFDRSRTAPITAAELIAFAQALGESRPEYVTDGPALVGHPTFCVRLHGSKFFPDNLPESLRFRMSFDAGKDIELGVPVRVGDEIEIRSTLHDVYEKTGRSGSMVFVVVRFTLTNQRNELVATVDNRFMYRGRE
jgi:hypothetical protein